MAARGAAVNVHHIRDVRPPELSTADLYVFSSPGRIGKPIRGMRRFLKKVELPAGTHYAILTTEAMPKRDKKTGRMPTEDELARYQRVRPIMNEILQGKGLVNVAEAKVHVTGLKGPLEQGWEVKVRAFATRIPLSPSGHVPPPSPSLPESFSSLLPSSRPQSAARALEMVDEPGSIALLVTV
jgi:hypothetical protein